MASISRAFTQRRVKKPVPFKRSDRDIPDLPDMRLKISGPVQLLHTTNMLSYNAPDIVPRTMPPPSSSPPSASFGSGPVSVSGDDSDELLASAASTPPTSPDDVINSNFSFSSPSLSQKSYRTDPLPPLPVLGSSYRFLPPQSSKFHGALQSKAPLPLAYKRPDDPPAIPRRAPSHAKKSSVEAAARARSHSHTSDASKDTDSRASSSSSAVTTSTIPTLHSTAPSRKASLASLSGLRAEDNLAHPFMQELAQVSELAAEFGAIDPMLVRTNDPEEAEMASRGLLRFTAEEYAGELHSVLSLFPEWIPIRALTTSWI